MHIQYLTCADKFRRKLFLNDTASVVAFCLVNINLIVFRTTRLKIMLKHFVNINYHIKKGNSLIFIKFFERVRQW